MFRAFLANLILCVTLVPLTAWAQFDMQTLKSLHEAGEAQRAYDYATKYLEAMEGEPEFDFYYGAAAIARGQASEGVFALERVIALYPDYHGVRLELARGYFILEDYPRAQAEVEYLLASRPPDPVRAQIERFLDAVNAKQGRYRTVLSGYAEAGVGYDSNVNGAPDGASFSTDAGPVVLDDEAVEAEDAFSVLAGGFRFDRPFAPDKSLFGTGDIDYRLNQSESDFDNATLDLRGGLTLFGDPNRYQLDVQLQRYILDDDTYRDLLALNGEWGHRLSPHSQLSTFAQWGNLDYPDQALRDSQLVTLGTGITHNVDASLSPVVYLSGYLGVEDPDSDSTDAEAVADREFIGLRAGAHLDVGRRSTVSAHIVYQTSRYAGALEFTATGGSTVARAGGNGSGNGGDMGSGTGGEMGDGSNTDVGITSSGSSEREDDYTSLNAEWIWRIRHGWNLRSRAGYAVNDSNSQLNDFDRYVVDFRLRYEIL